MAGKARRSSSAVPRNSTGFGSTIAPTVQNLVLPDKAVGNQSHSAAASTLAPSTHRTPASTPGDKLLPLLLRALGEKPGASIDNFDQAERLGLLGSADEWVTMRRLRSQMVHEYVEDSASSRVPCKPAMLMCRSFSTWPTAWAPKWNGAAGHETKPPGVFGDTLP